MSSGKFVVVVVVVVVAVVQRGCVSLGLLRLCRRVCGLRRRRLRLAEGAHETPAAVLDLAAVRDVELAVHKRAVVALALVALEHRRCLHAAPVARRQVRAGGDVWPVRLLLWLVCGLLSAASGGHRRDRGCNKQHDHAAAQNRGFHLFSFRVFFPLVF